MLHLIKVTKKGYWDSGTVRRIMGWYQEVNPMTPDERQVLAVDVQFPHLFVGAVDKHFTGRARDWTPAKMQEKLAEAIRADRDKYRVLAALRG